MAFNISDPDFPFSSDYAADATVYLSSAHNPDTPVLCAILSVSDVERLAKAGVKIEWETIRDQVRPDPVPDKTDMFDCTQLLRPLIARLGQQATNKATKGYFPVAAIFDRVDGAGPPFMSAVARGEKVYVFAAINDQPPLILEDDLHLYPSDALMAKLHLLNKLNREQ